MKIKKKAMVFLIILLSLCLILSGCNFGQSKAKQLANEFYKSSTEKNVDQEKILKLQKEIEQLSKEEQKIFNKECERLFLGKESE